MANAISALASNVPLPLLPCVSPEVAPPALPVAPAMPPPPRALTLPPFSTPLAQAVLRLLPAMTASRTEAPATGAQTAQPPLAAAPLPVEARSRAAETAPERASTQIPPAPPPPVGPDDAQRAWAALSSGLLTPALLRHAHGFASRAAAGTNPDTALIQAAQETAFFIGCRLEVSAEFGQISPDDMFSTSEAPGTPLAALAERFAPVILGDLLLRDERILLAMATTRTSFVPTARIALRLPFATSATQLDAASRGHRRLYDPTARERAPFTLRPCGIALAKDVTVSGMQISAPVLVDGRHWGCLRLAYRRD